MEPAAKGSLYVQWHSTRENKFVLGESLSTGESFWVVNIELCTLPLSAETPSSLGLHRSSVLPQSLWAHRSSWILKALLPQCLPFQLALPLYLLFHWIPWAGYSCDSNSTINPWAWNELGSTHWSEVGLYWWLCSWHMRDDEPGDQWGRHLVLCVHYEPEVLITERRSNEECANSIEGIHPLRQGGNSTVVCVPTTKVWTMTTQLCISYDYNHQSRNLSSREVCIYISLGVSILVSTRTVLTMTLMMRREYLNELGGYPSQCLSMDTKARSRGSLSRETLWSRIAGYPFLKYRQKRL